MDSKRDIRNKRWLSRWSQLRKQGVVRFSIINGGLYFALLIALYFIISASFGFSFLGRFIFESFFQNLVFSATAGFALSSGQWLVNEIRFRRLWARYPNAVRLL